MPREIRHFALVTLAPVPLLLAGVLFGMWWNIAALLYLTVATFVVDALAPRDGAVSDDVETADTLSSVLAAVHFVMLGFAVLSIAGTGSATLADRVTAFFAFGIWFGQVSNSNAHELIHRAAPRLRRLGTWVYISLLFGHHASAHPAVHHRFVATPSDPNTARRGESFYRFMPRAWRGSFRAGWLVEAARLRQQGRSAWHPANPYYAYCAGAAGMLILSWLIAGPWGVLVHAGLAFYAQSQLLLSDYVQHYGLLRARIGEGKYAPVSPRDSWNAAHWMSGLTMMNAPRHSDHHAHPAKPYPLLGDMSSETAPALPYSLPLMGAIALAPRAWRRIMHPRLDALTSARVPAQEPPPPGAGLDTAPTLS